MKKFCLVLLGAVIALFCTCYKRSDLSTALYYAYDNKEELENALRHYMFEDPNPEKLAAAQFLIENMPGHYSYSSSEIYSYYAYADSILADTSLTPEQQRDSLLAKTDSRFVAMPFLKTRDIEIVKADYLIDNIDKSYAQWKTCPWASHLSFEDYLEWLLPYKAVEFQELDAWRDTMLAHFGTCLEHPVKNDVEYNTTLGVAEMIRNEAYHVLNRHGLYTRAGLPLLTAHLQVSQTFGDIPDYALTAVLAFRAAGVPAVLDETPVGSRYTAATKWYVILSDRGEELTSEWDLATMIGGGFFPDERGPKVYRNTYAINKERLDYLRYAKFCYPFELGKKDVTSKYFLTSDLEIPIDMVPRIKLNDMYVLIASAVRDDMNPRRIVDFGTMKRGKACFHDMGREVLYRVMGYEGNRLINLSEPFILHKDGSLEYINADTINSVHLDKWNNNAL